MASVGCWIWTGRAETDGSTTASPSGKARRRALWLGLILGPLNAYWIILAELRWANLLTLAPPFVASVFCLFAPVAINAGLRFPISNLQYVS